MSENIKSVSQVYKVQDIIYIGLFAAFIAICSWIAIPATVPFTLQTMGIFITVGLLGGKRATIAIFVYILLGIIGIPVFASFSSGLGAILGTSGGYIIGFLFSALFMWFIESVFGNRHFIFIISMLIGLLICYSFGTFWFMMVYTQTTGPVALSVVLVWCVIPFIIPDLIKIALSFLCVNRLKKIIKK